MAAEPGTCCHAGRPGGEQLVCLAKPLECVWWGRKLGSGWWVCSRGVFPPSEQMGLKEFPEGGGTAPPREGPKSFSCPDGPFIKRLFFLLHMALPRPGFPHSRGSFLSRRGGGAPKRRPEPGSPGPTGALSVGAGTPELMAGLRRAQVRPGAIICRGCPASSGADTKGAPAQALRLCPSMLVTAAAHLGAQGTWGPRDGLGPVCLDLPLRPASSAYSGADQ